MTSGFALARYPCLILVPVARAKLIAAQHFT